MSETSVETPPTTAPEAPSTPPAESVQDPALLPQWARDAITKANKEAANYRTQVNELKPQAEQFRSLEEASKTEAQRLSETAEAAKRDAEAARSEAIRYKAAATHGISADHFDLLGSGTEEEISARAEKIAALVAAQSTPPPLGAPGARPVEQLRPGATPSEVQNEDEVLYQHFFPTP